MCETHYNQIRAHGVSVKWLDEHKSCGICGSSEGKMVVDHDHETGEVRGLLCDSCNVGLGRFDDDPDMVKAALEYLDA